MPEQSTNSDEVVRLAYEKAWREFSRFPNLSPDEKLLGPAELRGYIETMVDAGQRDPEKIASSVLGRIRESEQIARSKARIAFRYPALPFSAIRPVQGEPLENKTLRVAATPEARIHGGWLLDQS